MDKFAQSGWNRVLLLPEAPNAVTRYRLSGSDGVGKNKGSGGNYWRGIGGRAPGLALGNKNDIVVRESQSSH